MKKQGCSWLLETGKCCIDRTAMFTLVNMPVSTCRQVITTTMAEYCCNNIVAMAEQRCSCWPAQPCSCYVVHAGQHNVVHAGQLNVVHAGQLNVVHAGQHNVVHTGQLNVVHAGKLNLQEELAKSNLIFVSGAQENGEGG